MHHLAVFTLYFVYNTQLAAMPILQYDEIKQLLTKVYKGIYLSINNVMNYK